jgi:hypothetical protein
MKGTSIKRPPFITTTIKEWIKLQSLEEEHLDARSKAILDKAANVQIKVPSWKEIADISLTLDTQIGHPEISPQLRAIKWKEMKLPTYVFHDYMRQLQVIFKACQCVVGHWQKGFLLCKICNNNTQANADHFKYHHRDVQLPVATIALINKVRSAKLLIESATDMASIIEASHQLIKFWEPLTIQGAPPASKKRRHLSPTAQNPPDISL